MKTIITRVLRQACALAIVAAAPLGATIALAQDAAPPAAAKTPAATVKTDDAKAKTAKTKVKTKKAKTTSPCKGLAQAACGGNKACAWIVPKDANDKTGKLQKPYCRKVAGVAAKKKTPPKPAKAVKPAKPAAAPAQ